MRWRFLDPDDPQELSVQKIILADIDAWWSEFASKTEQLQAHFSRQASWDLPEWMATHLERIQPGLMWEFGPGVCEEGHRLVITPESKRHLRPLVTTILARAPRIAGWEFYPYRLPESLELARISVNARVGYDISDFQVQVRLGENNRIDVCFFSPNIESVEDKQARHAAFVATESLLGEQCLDRWIGAIEVAPLPSTGGLRGLFRRDKKLPPGIVPLERMQDTVAAVVGSVTEQLSDRPHYAWIDEANGTVWKLKPELREDYIEQTDMFVGKSINPPLWTAAHSGDLFYSERFSRCGETFCYVKLDGSEGLDEEKFADKGEIEDALDEVLKPNQLGCRVGGGHGQRYSYIDLALVDVERGIEAVRQRLQEGNVPKRSWIQFFDADLAAEWIGIYDDSPPPPMPEFE
jgi:hypothetical protein